MTTDVMTEQQTTPAAEPRLAGPPRNLDPAVQAIIDRARASAPRRSARATWILPLLSAGLLWASFPPLDWSLLAWVSLVPLVVLIRMSEPLRWMYTATYLGGLVFTLVTLQWMRLGDPTMYVAWVALAVYVAVYFPVFVGLARCAVHSCRIPLVFAVPAVWVGLEFFRAYLLTGFSWYYLAHTQYRWIELIQISDLVGAYGVSFLVAMTAAVIAGVIPETWLERFQLQPRATAHGMPARRGELGVISVLACLATFAAALVYGHVRRSQAEFTAGPRVAVVQGNFTAAVKHDPDEAQEIFNRHIDLTFRAVQSGHKPDWIVWPETMFRNTLFAKDPGMGPDDLRRVAPEVPAEYWFRGRTRDMLATLSKQAGAALVIGLDSAVADPDGFAHYNSAAFVTPDAGLSGRYDKIHRVPFGEYIPLRDTFPFLHRFTPFGPEYGISAGDHASVFAFDGWRGAPLICFEDTVPQFVRRIVQTTRQPETEAPVDFLVNLTNDGWFHGSSELDQHLITAAFRSVEHRLPSVRAVNTGISAFIDGDGVILEPDHFIDGDNQDRTTLVDPESGRWRKQLNAALIHTLPLDNRRSLYSHTGDWFAGLCGVLCLVLILWSVVERTRQWQLRRASLKLG